MKLLFSCGGSYVSGMEIVELSLMRGLMERGHDVHALVSGWNDGDFAGRLESAGIPYTVAYTGKITVRKPAWMLDTLRHLPGARRAVHRLVRDLRPDAVVACNRDALILLTGVWGGTPVVYHTHELMAPAWTARVARSADRFVAVSEFVADRLAEDGVPRELIDVVWNGVDLAEPALPSDGEPPVVGICGQIGPWKGHDDLLDAVGRLAVDGVACRLRIFGTGDATYTAALRERADALGIADRLEWMGFVADPDRMYAGLDVLAVPSRIDETFGMTAAEAGARGIPVLATRRGGLPEVVVDGETGRLIPPASPSALADALAVLLTNPDRRHAMGQAARSHIASQLTTERMVDRFEAVMQDAVGGLPLGGRDAPL